MIYSIVVVITSIFTPYHIVSYNDTPIKIETKNVEEERLDKLADEIWLLESTRGKNNYSKCEAVGKINGIGYGIWGGHWICFDSHEEEMEVLKKWITDKEEKGMSEVEWKCLYSGNHYKICSDRQTIERRNEK